ncbi:DoxX family protein [Candidatus Woesearchaeota archaeon]|nr:DoxX family protein [Candidatus Woesearchaeota archaeon]
MKDFLDKNQEVVYFVFRLIVGLLFMFHGLQKVFGVVGGTAQPIFSFMGLIGILELLAGLFVAIGLLTRFFSAVGLIVMIGAYFKVHAFKALFPIMNGGELATLYLVCFLLILFIGSGKYDYKIFYK